MPSLSTDDAATQFIAHVLVVDPQGDTRQLYVEGLEACGYRVTSGHDGADALEYARSLRPSAAVMELRLPILTGVEVASLLQQDSSTERIRLVAITSSTDVALIHEALDVGFTSVLLKPCPPDKLASELCRILTVNPPRRRWVRGLQRSADETIPPIPYLQATEPVVVEDEQALRRAAMAARLEAGTSNCPFCEMTDRIYQFRWKQGLWHRCTACGAVWRWRQRSA